nr:psychosine receptor-like [Misgurnus anguillicaudatus]
MNITTVNWMTTPSQNDSEDCYPSIQFENNFFLGLHLVVILLGIPANAFFLFVSCQHIRQKNELGVYLFNLALSDLLYIMCLPVWIEFMLNDEWPYSKIACAVCVFLLYTNFYTSTVLLSCIAVDRYLAVVHPLKFSAFRKRRTAVIVSIAAWIFTVIFNAITVDSDEIYDAKNFICLDVFPLQDRQRRGNYARFIVGFFVPAVIVGFCYWRIYLAVKKSQSIEVAERRHVFKLLGSILLTLYLCFGPFHIMLVLRSLLEVCSSPSWLYIGFKITIALSTLNCLADPLLYCFSSRMGQASALNALIVLRRTRKTEKQKGIVNSNGLMGETIL